MKKIVFYRKNGHSFLEFYNEVCARSVCVDGWLNPRFCPDFCKPVTVDGWEPVHVDKSLHYVDEPKTLTLVCPTSFGYISRRGAFRNSGGYHNEFILDKSGLDQFIYNYNYGG